MQNKKSWIGLVIVGVMMVSAVLPQAASVVAAAQVPTATETPTVTIPPPTNTSQPTETPTQSNQSGSFVRPQIAVKSYRTNPATVQYGQDFKLFIRLKNEGQVKASNVQATFAPGDFLPLKNGGVIVVGELGADNAVDIEQSLTASTYLYGNSSVDMTVSYYDENGASYSEKFTINILVGGGSFVNVATSTPTGVNRSQLVISGYQTNVVVLEPGVQFTLQMIVQNVGSAMAKGVTMIVGGGSASSSGGETPAPGGVSGGGGEFSNFAPVGSSNVQSLGDIDKGASISATQQLIANVSINPGAYPVKVTFSYFDNKNNLINDEQVITLLVYNLPNVDVSFYQPVISLMAGQPNPLPLQLTNLGRRSVVLGTMKIQTDNGSIENSETLVGALDTGGYFTFDSLVIPDEPGTLTISITIDYTDDFNQARTIKEELLLEVMEMPVEVIPDPSQEDGAVDGGGFESGAVEESFIRKAWRFVLGLLGLDSAPPTDSQPVMPEEVPIPDPGGEPSVGPKG